MLRILIYSQNDKLGVNMLRPPNSAEACRRYCPPQAFCFSIICYFYWTTQREPLRRRECWYGYQNEQRYRFTKSRHFTDVCTVGTWPMVSANKIRNFEANWPMLPFLFQGTWIDCFFYTFWLWRVIILLAEFKTRLHSIYRLLPYGTSLCWIWP